MAKEKGKEQAERGGGGGGEEEKVGGINKGKDRIIL